MKRIFTQEKLGIKISEGSIDLDFGSPTIESSAFIISNLITNGNYEAQVHISPDGINWSDLAISGLTALEVAKGAGVLTLTGNITDGDTVTIDGKVYTFQDTLTDVDGNVHIGATASDTIDNLIDAINLGTGAGTDYATSMTLHSTVSAAAGAGDTMDATAKVGGIAGNVATTKSSSTASWGATTLLGGLDALVKLASINKPANAIRVKLIQGSSVAANGILTLTGNLNALATAAGILTLTDNMSDAIAATGILTAASNPDDTDTIVIDGKTYTLQDTLTDVDGNVHIGATASDTLDNLIAAINLGAGAGTDYATAMTLHPTVSAAAGAGDTMDATAKTAGTAGNSLATTATGGEVSWGAVNLEGGLAPETVTIGSTVYTFKTALTAPAVPFEVLIGAAATNSIDNLIAAINQTSPGEGTLYALGTTKHPTVSAAAGAGDTMDATAKTAGAGGNSIDTLETGAVSSWGATDLAGGLNADTVTIAGTVYTFQSTLIDAAYNVKIGATASITIDNLIAAINGAAGAGTLYGTGTQPHTRVTAAAGAGDTMDVTSKIAGIIGNGYATTKISADAGWGAGILENGADGATGTVDVKIVSAAA